jgi:ABC-type lipoprotein release transport system permease subunit
MMFKLFGFWIKTACLFLFRSVRSTVVLSLMIVAAVSALIFLSALAVGINDTMIRNSVSLFAGHISGYYLPASLQTENLLIDGVAGVLKRVSVSGTLSHGDRIEPVTLIGINPSEEKKCTALWKKTIQGKYLQRGEKTGFISQALAETLNVQPGNTLKFKPTFAEDPFQLTISGIYKTGIDQLDRGTIFYPLNAIPFKPDTWWAAIFLKEGVEPDTILTEYRRTLGSVQHFKSWEELMPDLRQLIDLSYVSMAIVMILVFGVVSLGIACAFVIFILKNLKEYGIMKAMGVTSREMTFFIVIEVILMNLAASFIGVVLGVLIVFSVGKIGIDLTSFTSYNRYFVVSGMVFPRLTFYSLCLPPAMSMFFSLASALWPAVLVAWKKTADILRIV